MKKLFTTLVMTAVMGTTAFAADDMTYDFTYQGLAYKILDAAEHTCEVAKANWKLEPLPYGNIVVPEKVSDGTTEYTVVAVGEMAFNWNTAVSSVTLPESVKTLNDYAFNRAENATNIIANGVTSMGESCIQDCNSLINLEIGSIQKLVSYSISNSPALSELVLPSSFTSPQGRAIENMTGLKKVTLGAGVSEWTTGSVFTNCENIEEVIFTDDVTKVAQNIFSGMNNIRSVTCKATTPPQIPAGLFKTLVYNQAGLFVPAASVEAYKNDAVWSKFVDIFPIAASVDEPVVMLNETSFRGIPGETLQLTAQIFPEEVVDKTVTWTSSNEAVATVDANGLITLVAVGDAEITASIPKATAKCDVKVVSQNITLNITKTTESINSTLQLVATVTGTVSTDEVPTWSSSDETIATVDSEGLVTIGDKTGIVTISASIGDVTATCLINAQIIAVTDFSVSPTTLTGEVGKTAQINCTFVPENATDKTVTWYVQDEQVAKCDENGLVSFLEIGSTAMFANCAGFNRMITITVKAATIGVDTVEAADAEAEYYDLQGRRVMNPEKGIYLRKAAGKTAKVVL